MSDDKRLAAVISASLTINSASALGTQLSPIPSVSGKMADWIRMPHEMVSGVGRGTGVLDGDGDR